MRLHGMEGLREQCGVSCCAYEGAGRDTRSPAIAYLSDTRKVKVVVHIDQDWADEVWIPLLIGCGVKRFALVTAPSGLGKITVEEVVERVDNRGLLMRSFDSVAAARFWLAELTGSRT